MQLVAGLVCSAVWLLAAILFQVAPFGDDVMNIFWPPDGIAVGMVIAYGPRLLPPLGITIFLWNLAGGKPPVESLVGCLALVLALLAVWQAVWWDRRQNRTTSPIATMVRYHCLTVIPAVVILSIFGSWQFIGQSNSRSIAHIVVIMAISETLGILLFARLSELSIYILESKGPASGLPSASLNPRKLLRATVLMIAMTLAVFALDAAPLPESVHNYMSASRYLTFALIMWAAYRGQPFLVHLAVAVSAIILILLTPKGAYDDTWHLLDHMLLLCSVALLGFLASASMEHRALLADEQRARARRDPLTGWMNERGLVAALAETPRSGYLIGVDIQNIRQIMELIGLLLARQIEKDITTLLRLNVNEGIAFARPCDGFFVMVLPTEANANGCLSRLKALLTNRRYDQGMSSVRIEVGIAVLPLMDRPTSESVADTLATLMLTCQLSSFGQKRGALLPRSDSTGQFSLGDMIKARQGQLVMLEDLKETLQQPSGSPDSPGLWLACQTIQPLKQDVTTYSFEILMRWTLPDGTVRGPAIFLPIAEHYGLMPDIDRWVIAEAMRTFAAIPEKTHRKLSKVSINLSGASISEPYLLEFIQATIRDNSLSPSLFCFEITETADIVQRENAISLLTRMRDMGIRTSLDDFGTGLASFDYLKSLPLDYVKIDGSFIRHLDASLVDQAIVKAICRVARILDLETVAEFVETPRQYALLEEWGVDHVQGYHIGKPVYIGDHLKSIGQNEVRIVT